MKISNTKMVIEISSNSDSDSDDDNSSNNDSELEKSIIDQKQIRYFLEDTRTPPSDNHQEARSETEQSAEFHQK